MNDKFDELTKNLAQSVTRRGALKKFGTSLAAIALASVGLAQKAIARDRAEGAMDLTQRYNCKCDDTQAYGCKTRACFQYCAPRCAG